MTYQIKVRLDSLDISVEFIESVKKAVKFLTETMEMQGDRGKYTTQRLKQDLELIIKRDNLILVYTPADNISFKNIEALSDHLRLPIDEVGVEYGFYDKNRKGSVLVRLRRSALFSEGESE